MGQIACDDTGTTDAVSSEMESRPPSVNSGAASHGNQSPALNGLPEWHTSRWHLVGAATLYAAMRSRERTSMGDPVRYCRFSSLAGPAIESFAGVARARRLWPAAMRWACSGRRREDCSRFM
jgi:hypothetical protein